MPLLPTCTCDPLSIGSARHCPRHGVAQPPCTHGRVGLCLECVSREIRQTEPAAENPLKIAPRRVAPAPSALDVQVGGGHYKDMKIQPVEFIQANNLGFLEGCVIKRICRWRAKDGIKDLEKIKHEVDLLIELERRNQAGVATPAGK